MANSIVCLNMSVFEISPNKDIVLITLYIHSTCTSIYVLHLHPLCVVEPY